MIAPEALHDRLAVLTAEMSDEQRRDLAELLLSGEVDVELLALVLRDQATVESDSLASKECECGTTTDATRDGNRMRCEECNGTVSDPDDESAGIAPGPWTVDQISEAQKDQDRRARRLDEPRGPRPSIGLGSRRGPDWADPSEPLAPEAIETVESAPKFRDDTRLLQCCNVARLIGHRAGCAEAN